jgi:hypothetical protein
LREGLPRLSLLTYSCDSLLALSPEWQPNDASGQVWCGDEHDYKGLDEEEEVNWN